MGIRHRSPRKRIDSALTGFPELEFLAWGLETST